jgi:hypothetical protein
MRNALRQARRPQPPSARRALASVLRRTAQRKAPGPGRGTSLPPERTLTRGRCYLSRPAASHTTMPPMTGPEHYHRAEQLLAEASQIIRFRQQPGQSGPADLPGTPHGRGRTAEAVHRPWPPGPDHRRSPGPCHARPGRRHRGRRPGSGQPGLGRRRWNQVQQRIGPAKDHHPLAGLPPYGPDHNLVAAGAAARRWWHARPVAGRAMWAAKQLSLSDALVAGLGFTTSGTSLIWLRQASTRWMGRATSVASALTGRS